MRRSALLLCILIGGLLPVGFTATSRAKEPSSAETAEATALFKTGKKLFEAGQYDEAIEVLERSNALLPSGNTRLLIAHCHRLAGHPVNAIEAYEAAIVLLGAKVDSGVADAKKYLDEAAKWKVALAQILGQVRVLAPEGATVLVNGATVQLSRSGNDFIATTWVQPGAVEILEKGSPNGPRTVTVAAGASVDVDLRAADPTPAATPVAPARTMLVTGVVVGAVGLAEMGLFIGFGLVTKAFHERDAACKDGSDVTACLSDAEREEARRDQVVADVSLGLGIASIATGVALVVADAVLGPQSGAAGGQPAKPLVAIWGDGFYCGVAIDL
ncbi:MAG: CDC27 family protein [Polyangiaceae bacterium]